MAGLTPEEQRQRAIDARGIPRTVVPEAPVGPVAVGMEDAVHALAGGGAVSAAPPVLQGVVPTASNPTGATPVNPADTVGALPSSPQGVPPDVSVGAGYGVGAPVAPLSDVSSDASSNTNRTIYRPQDVAASDAAHREAAIAAGGKLAAEAATGQAVGAEHAGFANKLTQDAAAHQARQDELARAHTAAIKARDDANAEYQRSAANVPLGTVLNPSAGQTVASILGLILSGAGSGLAKQPNLAAAMLESEYKKAWNERQSKLGAMRENVSVKGRAVDDATAARSAENQDWHDYYINMANISNARLQSLAELRKDPEARAAAKSLIAEQEARIADATAERNKTIKSSNFQTHTPSALESNLKLVNAQRQNMAMMASLTDDQRKTMQYVEQQRDKRGINTSRNALASAYELSDGFKNIPGSFTRYLSQLGGEAKGGIGNVVAGYVSRGATNDRERAFANSLQELISSATKAYAGGNPSDKERQVYNIVSGLGANASTEQVRDRLWQLTRLTNERDAQLQRANGVYGFYEQATGQRPLPERPTDAPVRGMTPRGR